MKKQYVIFALLILTARLAHAQTTNDCDVAAPTSFTVDAGTRTFTICWNPQDTAGVPVSPVEWAVILNGIRVPIAMAQLPLPATATGLLKYSGTHTVTKGSYTGQFEVVISDGIGGTISTQLAAPFTLRVKSAPPKAPINAKVQ